MSSYKSNQTSNDLSEEEDWEDYIPGGYHPVHIGDLFSDGRYTVVRKLGFVIFNKYDDLVAYSFPDGVTSLLYGLPKTTSTSRH
jgi:hypothetical protein